jgi:hypothetical protein
MRQKGLNLIIYNVKLNKDMIEQAFTRGFIKAAQNIGINASTAYTSKDSQERALKIKARHPYATSLPFGDMVGATVA